MSDYERQWMQQQAVERSHNADYQCRKCGTRFRQYIMPGDEWQTCPNPVCNENCYPFLIQEIGYEPKDTTDRGNR